MPLTSQEILDFLHRVENVSDPVERRIYQKLFRTMSVPLMEGKY